MIKNNKGQAAVEFLVTYGWAILGVLITISALSYMGVFNTQRFVNDYCNFGEQLICEDYKMLDDGTISLQLRNNFGVDIEIIDVKIKSDYEITPKECTYTSLASLNIASSTTEEFVCDATTSTLKPDSKFKARVITTFRRAGTTEAANEHIQNGDVMITVQESP